MTYSYDIFDTCIVRACGQPSFVFDLLAKRILGESAEMSALLDFAMERRVGELRARQQLIMGECEEVTLDEIYEVCDFSIFTSQSKETIKSIELKIEKEVSLPVYSVCQEIEELRKKGHSIIYISDIYLPEEFVKSLLEDKGFLKDGDRLYVSSKYRQSKSTGNLFKLIGVELNMNYKEWIHKGDNRKSDYYIPRKIGIRAKLINHDYSYYERLLIRRKLVDLDNSMQIMAGIARSVRLTNENSPQVKFAADFIAPAYVPFVYWILGEAQKRKINKLFFMARDGFILYRIAQCFSSCFPDIELHYLYASRKSLYLPGLQDFSKESIASMFWNIKNVTILEILDMLQMEQYPVELQKFEGLKSYEAIDMLLQDEIFVRGLRKRYHEQRDLCQRYLKEQGLTNGECAIVDLAGTRKCHLIINSILQTMGAPSVYAFYLLVNSTRAKGNDYCSLYYLDRNSISAKGVLSLPDQDFFEQYFSIANHGRTSSYRLEKEMVVPVFESDIANSQIKETTWYVNEMVCCLFARFFSKIITRCVPIQLCNAALSGFADFYVSPSKEYLQALENVRFCDSNASTRPIIDKKSKLSILYSYRKSKWPNATLVYNFIWPRIITAWYRLRVRTYWL